MNKFYKKLAIYLLALTAVFFSVPDGQAQSDEDRKFEVGGQFSTIRIDNNPIALEPNERRSETGFGGRLAYNFTKHFALESEVNFFPRRFRGFVTPLSGGRIVHGLFGVKAGIRKNKFGFFAKGRPGFVRYTGSVENVRFPNGNGPNPRDPFGFEFGSTTHLAVDVGGVVEYYPSRRTILRFDGGDTIIRYANIPVTNFPSGEMSNVTEYQHNAQFSIGFGFRF